MQLFARESSYEHIAYWIPASSHYVWVDRLINVLCSNPKENNSLTSLKSKRRRLRLSSPVRQQKTADVGKSWHLMKCGGLTVERQKIYMYLQPSESQLVRIIEFVSGADKNWIIKLYSLCGLVLKSQEGWGTLSMQPFLSILKQVESFRSANKIEYCQGKFFFFSHLDTWSLVHNCGQLFCVVCIQCYINDFFALFSFAD